MRKIMIFLMIIASLSLCSCTSQYDKDLESGINKMYTGEKMTKGEKQATNDFLEWQKNQ